MATSLLGDSSRSEQEKAEMLEMVKRATARIDRLVKDLVEVGRMEAGRGLAIEAACADVAPVLREVCAAHAAMAGARQLRVVCDAPAALPPVYVDCHRLMQVLSNLVGNAIKFTPAGGTISVAAAVAGGELRVPVKDTGDGMEAEDLERIFDPYWQAERTACLGAGLGLKIAKGIVEAHGGRIWARSAPGQGTTFVFTLPLAGA
jgi:signal transduction histidine kinase